MVFASGFPADGAKPRGSDVSFGDRRPLARNLAVGRYCSGVSLMTPQVEWGARAPGPGRSTSPGPHHQVFSPVTLDGAFLYSLRQLFANAAIAPSRVGGL